MTRLMFSGLILCCISVAVGGDAQSQYIAEKPVWSLEFIKVSPDKYGPTMGHLDEQWMRIRDEAKRQGSVLSYYRISDAGLVTPDHQPGDQTSIVLLTEYKNATAFLEREKTFGAIREHLSLNTPGVLRSPQENLYKTMHGHLFMEVPVEDNPHVVPAKH